MGIVGPGEVADVTIRFEPTEAKWYQCIPTLRSLKVDSVGNPTNEHITNACPSTLNLEGTRYPIWEDCSVQGGGADLYGIHGHPAFLFAVGNEGRILELALDW